MSQPSDGTMTAGGRPLTAVRLGPLTCFCACTPAGAAATVNEEQSSEFFAEEVYDSAGSSAKEQVSLPPPAEAVVPAVVVGGSGAAAASQKPAAAAKQHLLPQPLPEAVKEAEGSPMKVIVDSSSAAPQTQKVLPAVAYALKDPKSAQKAETKAADAMKAAAAVKQPAAAPAASRKAEATKAAAKSKTKTKAKPQGQPFKKQKSGEPPPPYCEMCVVNSLLRLVAFALVVSVLILFLMGALSIAQLVSAYPEVKKAQSGLVDDSCSITSWNPLDEPPRSDSYEALVWGQKWKLEKFIDGLDKSWMGVSCTVTLNVYGKTRLAIYDQKRWWKPWSSALKCSEEIPKLKEKTFPCCHLPAPTAHSLDQWGAFAASKEDISNVIALDVYWVTSAYGFPMAAGIPFAFVAVLLLALLLLVALKLRSLAARRWRLVHEQRRARICTIVRSTLRWLLSLVLLAVIFLAGFLAISSALRAHRATKELQKTMEHGSCTVSHAGINADPSTDPPVSYSITIGKKEFEVPSKNMPHTSLAWAIKSCYVKLVTPKGNSLVNDDGLATLTVFQADRLLKFYKPSLECADLLGTHKKEGFCSYAPNNVGGWGVLFGSKDSVPSYWMLFLMRASRSGAPFIIAVVYSAVIAITVVALLVMLLQRLIEKMCKFRFSEWLKRRRRKAGAREIEPDVEALAPSVPYRLLH